MNQLEERNSAGTLTARYAHGEPIAPGVGSVVEVQRITATTTYFQYLHMDHQGSVAKVTDANQNIQIAYVNDAFGRQIVAPTGANPAVPNDLVFQSNWITANIGTKRYGISPSRVYDFETGRFLQRDPLPNGRKIIGKTAGNGLGIFSNSIFESILSSNYYRIYDSFDNIYTNMMSTNGSDPSGFGLIGEIIDEAVKALAAEVAKILEKELVLKGCPDIWKDNVSACLDCCQVAFDAGGLLIAGDVASGSGICTRSRFPWLVAACTALVVGWGIHEGIELFNVNEETKEKCKGPPGTPEPKDPYPPKDHHPTSPPGGSPNPTSCPSGQHLVPDPHPSAGMVKYHCEPDQPTPPTPPAPPPNSKHSTPSTCPQKPPASTPKAKK